MEALLFDLDGVLYQGDRIIDGAVETLQWCEQRRIPHLFVTNTSWVDSEVDKWGLLDNILVQVEHDSFESENGVQVVPTLVVFEHRNGKRWREWRFSPRIR